MTQTYSVFQSDTNLATRKPAKRRPLRALGFFGRVIEGAGIVAFTLFVAVLTLTGAARADTLLADTGVSTGPVMTLAVLAVFAVMLVMVRQTWRQTTKGIEQASRRSHRIG